jgi:hypothetical protein
VFPDPTVRWRPYPSIIDGIERPPYVFGQGLWRGVLHLIVLAPKPSLRAYGVEIACEIYAGFEEMIYSVADHGASRTSFYNGDVYIKEAETLGLAESMGCGRPKQTEGKAFSLHRWRLLL